MKKVISLLLILVFVFSLTTVVFADKGGKDDPNTYIIPPEYEYVETSETFFEIVGWDHEHYNDGSLPDTTTYTVSREVSAEITACADVTVDAVVAEASYGLEVSFGTSTSWSTSVAFTCEPYAVTLCEYGSKFDKTIGTERYYWNGILQSSQTVYADWSYRSFSRKTILEYL